jgi:DNA adenine methylase
MSWNLTYGMRNVTDSSDQNGKELFISNYLEELPSMKQLDLFSRKPSLV